MLNNPSHLKTFKRPTPTQYDLFQEFEDGSSIWKYCVLGIENVEIKLLELTHESNGKYYAINFNNKTKPPIRIGCEAGKN
jgi:hypothetical protein